jgi:shikimate kinase
MLPLRRDKVYLVGFMAAGKTSAARLLAERLRWRAEDIDELIEARERMTVTDIFARFGEPYFRAAERDMMKIVLPLRETVVATGGGTFVDPDNRAAILLDGLSVWLDVPFSEIVARLPPDGRRPLSGDLAQLERLYHLRRPSYQQAHVRIDASGAGVTEVVKQILDALSRPF